MKPLPSHAVELLHALIDDEPMSTSAFAHEHGCDQQQIAQSVATLEADGCVIERQPHQLLLREAGLGVWRDYLQYYLQQRVGSPRSVSVYRSTSSTQDSVKQAGDTPLLVVADEQTLGRGRLGRQWIAPRGSAAMFSFNLPLDNTQHTHDALGLITAVAVAQAIESVSGTTVGIKWPNDILHNGRKLAGILIESRDNTAIIGIGINVTLTDAQRSTLPTDVRNRITTLNDLGPPVHRLHLIAQCMQQIHQCLKQPLAQHVETWRTRNVLFNQRVTLTSDGQQLTGTVMDIDAADGLILRRDSGELVHLHAATSTLQ